VAGTQSFVVADALAARGIPFVFCTGYGPDLVLPRFRDRIVVEKPIIDQVLALAMATAFADKIKQKQPDATSAG
jgi:hypothetical protein